MYQDAGGEFRGQHRVVQHQSRGKTGVNGGTTHGASDISLHIRFFCLLALRHAVVECSSKCVYVCRLIAGPHRKPLLPSPVPIVSMTMPAVYLEQCHDQPSQVLWETCPTRLMAAISSCQERCYHAANLLHINALYSDKLMPFSAYSLAPTCNVLVRKLVMG